MNRKWLAFPLSAGVLLVLGVMAGPGLYGADDDSPLGQIMEKVNKHNSTITKATRNKVSYTKSRKDVEKSAKELVKLGKEAKVITDAVKKAKIAAPQKKWDEYMDDLIKSSETLGAVAGKATSTEAQAKSAFSSVKKACADCHRDFRVEEGELLIDDVGMVCLDLTCASVAHELALDEALLIEADAGRGEGVLRFWEPADFAVVLGASCRLEEDVRVDACLADDVPILRRTSGGGTVVVGPGALNVSVILPELAAPGLSAVDKAHRYVLDWIAESIRRAGRPVTLEGRGDLVLGGRKCGGSAQRRLKHWFIVHCSILYDFPIERIDRYLAIPRRQPEYRQGRDHRDFLSNLGLPRNILMDAIGGDRIRRPGSAGAPTMPPALLKSLMLEKFANRAWIERL